MGYPAVKALRRTVDPRYVLTPRRLLATVLAAAAILPAPSAFASYADTPYSTATVVVPMHFPVLGPTSYVDTYLVCRSGCTRKHFGQDLMGPKMRPLVAAFNGYVSSLKRESYVGEGNYIGITGDTGWSVEYMHVNNDTPGTDDGKGTASYAFAPGIYVGKRVFAGELIGWSGDSGNAESTGPHLHFELRKGGPWGEVYNAFASLKHAYHDAYPTESGPHAEGTYIRGCDLCPVYRLEDGKKHLLRPDLKSILNFDPRTVVPVSRNEAAWYPVGADLQLPGGHAYRGPDGTVWFVAYGKRWVVTPEDLTALGIAGWRVRTATDIALGTVPKAPAWATLPTGITYDGALLRVPDATDAYWFVDGGELHYVTDAMTLRSWYIRTADAITIPAPVETVDGIQQVELPPLGTPLRLHDGAMVRNAHGDRYLVSHGVRRPLTSARVATMYGYTNVLVQAPPVDDLWRLPVGPALP